MGKNEKIAYASTVYGEKEISAVLKCLDEGTQMGKYTRRFERKIADLFEKKEALYVNSGSSALLLAIEALDLAPGSEVITPALTFGTTISCLIKNGLVPAFVDVAPLTYCIDVEQIEDMVTDNTVAILAPDLLGNLCDWEKIREIADKYGLIVIQDSADTLGAKINRHNVGYFTDISITSFYGSHIINCAGNGGAVCFNDNKAIERAKLLRSWGRSSSLFQEKSEEIENRFNVQLDGVDYDAKFLFELPGYNLEGNELGAAFGLVQLECLNKNILVRQENFRRQVDFFSKYQDLFGLPVVLENADTAFLAFPVLISNSAPFNRRDFQIYLEKQNIQTRVCFTGNIMRQPMMRGVQFKVSRFGYVNADNVMMNGVLLPVHHGMTESMFDRLHLTIDKFISSKK